jgi:hypothetical protein
MRQVFSEALAGNRADSRRLPLFFALADRQLTLGKPATIDANRSVICRLFHQKEYAV